jgi:hypothetical protein
MSSSPNPLQLGEVLYEILDATVIATPKGASSLHYNRVGITAAGGTVLDDSTLATGTIVDVRACADPLTGTMPVFILTAGLVTMIGAAGGASPETWTLPATPCTNVIGIDPTQTAQRTLLLLGQNATGCFLLPVTCMDGVTPSNTSLSLAGVAGTAQGGLLVRQQLTARVVVASIHNSHLLLYDLGCSALGASPVAPTAYPSVDLGATGGGNVSMTEASLFPSPDQQIAVTFVDVNQQINVAVLGWNAQGVLTTLATWVSSATAAPASGPTFSELTMENTTVRIAAGDVAAAGVDQLIVGFAATFQGTAGCAALLLFDVLGDPANPTLTFTSSYAAATADTPPQPLASIDLHLAAGLFGGVAGGGDGVLGVLLVGCGASATQLFSGEASVMTGIVPVAPTTHAFPSLGNAPGAPEYPSTVMTVAASTTSIVALPSDVTGQSVILGPPTLSQTSQAAGQLLAIVEAPPFEKNNSASPPTLTLSKGTSNLQGYNVSSNKTWMFTHDTGASIGIGSLTLGRTLSSSYGHGFTNVSDSSTTTQLQIASTISENDLMVLYAMDYDIWEYPVYRKATQSGPDGTLAVVFPQTAMPVQEILPASDASIGYKPSSQIGTLLSYQKATMAGYDSNNLIFQLVSVPVTDDSAGTTVTYDQTQMQTQNVGVDYMVHNSASDSAHFTFSKNLFDYLPVNFGLNMSDGTSYSENDVDTTSTSYTTSLSISISSGSVTDIEYTYQITPYIYQHDTMGCLIVTYDVTLEGQGWNTYYSNITMPILLMALMPNSKDLVLAGFSRDISFAEQTDGTVDVTVSMFNNSMSSVSGVTCELYLGAPVVSGQSLQPPSGAPAATQTLATLDGAARGTVTFNETLANPSQVTVKVYTTGNEAQAVVYWGIYPPSAFTNWKTAAGV